MSIENGPLSGGPSRCRRALRHRDLDRLEPTDDEGRDALRLGTRGGADVLGREDIGQLAPGKRADIAVWRTDGLELGGAADLPAALVLSGPHRVDRLFVGGEEVVRDGRLVRADEEEIAREHRIQAARLAPS